MFLSQNSKCFYYKNLAENFLNCRLNFVYFTGFGEQTDCFGSSEKINSKTSIKSSLGSSKCFLTTFYAANILQTNKRLTVASSLI